MTNAFSESTRLLSSSPSKAEILVSDLWNVGRIPNGGYLMAHCAKAMSSQIEHKDPIAVTAYYLDKTDNGEATVELEELRIGKSVSSMSAKLIQESSERVRFTAAFSDLEKTKGENYCESAAPQIADFDKCLDVSDVAPQLKMYEQFNMRFDPACCGWNEGEYLDKAEMNVWLEFKDQSAFDAYALLMVPDMLPPVIFTRYGANGWVPTIEMTVNVREATQDSRLQIRAKTRHLTKGLLEEDIEVWDSQGNIVAIARQLAKLRLKQS
jgi:acyl-CoA thioesterase